MGSIHRKMHLFAGKWIRTDHDNFKEYLKLIGVGKVKREIALKVGHDSNTVEFIPIDGGFIRKIKVGSLMSQTDTIKLDQEIELSDDTSKHKNLFTLLDDCILENQQTIVKAKAAENLEPGQVIKQRNTVVGDEMFVQLILNEDTDPFLVSMTYRKK